ncbi:MAG: hypothetical protein HYY84_16390 [Deltaproteobacteria bacterium]|nr:hypothetical protein [Deltaproteobacteria bacterium]
MLGTDEIYCIIRPLNEIGVRYAVTGSVASMIYGEPRMTRDVDIVIDLAAEKIVAFLGVFDTTAYYCPPEDVLRVEIARTSRGHFNIIHLTSGFKADFYPAGGDPLQRWALANRREVRAKNASLFLAPPEYVIVKKLEYHREGGSEKHLRDIRGMLDVTPELSTSTVLLTNLKELGLVPIWEKLLRDGE